MAMLNPTTGASPIDAIRGMLILRANRSREETA